VCVVLIHSEFRNQFGEGRVKVQASACGLASKNEKETA
jgi:hypothetical protein